MPEYVLFILFIHWLKLFCQSLFSSKVQTPVMRPTFTGILTEYLPWRKMFAFQLSLLRLRTDFFVGKNDEIQLLKFMAKFIADLTETHFTLGVLQLIFMAARSSLWFILLPLCVPHNFLARRLWRVKSQLHYPYYNSRWKSTQHTVQVRMSASVQKSLPVLSNTICLKGSSLWSCLSLFSELLAFFSTQVFLWGI